MSTKQKAIEAKKCMTPEFRVSFPNVFKAKAFEDQEPKFSVVMLFDKKKADLTSLKKAVAFAAQEKWGADKAKWPKNLRMPFRDGEEKSDMEGYAGCTFVSASSKQAPGVVDQARNIITEADQSFYAGCYARATLIAFAYDKAGNRGVSFSLQNLQKLRDGQPFSGRKKAEDEFDAVEDTEADNAENYGDGEGEDDDLGI